MIKSESIRANPLGRSVLVQWVVNRYWKRLTGAGRVLLVGALASMVFGASSMDVPIYLVWCGAVALLFAAAMTSYLYRPHVTATRRLPKHVIAGEKIEYDVVVSNGSGSDDRHIEVAEDDLPAGLKPFPAEPARLKLLPGGAEHELTLGIECARRGVYTLAPLSVTTSFPSGIVKARRGSSVEQQLLVYPYFKRLGDFALPTSRTYQPGGISMTSDVGDSTEFLCTREYREGDSIRDIHWASWARTGKPVVKVFQEEYFVRLAMLLDSEVRIEDDRAFEAGISLAASVADVLSRQEYIIDIFAAGDKIYRFQAGRALAHFDNILQILACITHAPRVDINGVLQALSPEAGRLSALMCIMMDWDEDRRRLVKTLNSLGLATRTIIVRDDPPTMPVEGEPGVSWWRPGEVLEAFN